MKILLRTKSYLVVHKPSGMPVYSDRREDTNNVVAKLQATVGSQVFPVHRLDAETCGVVLLALDRQKASDFTRQFKEKKVTKKYLAFVSGNPPDQISFNKPLKKNKSNETESAQTKFKTLERVEININGEDRNFALVECEPLTGRYHQIRRHLKMLDCPIVGDKTYGNEWVNQVFEEEYKIKRTLLSAGILQFLDPISRKKQTVSTFPDEDFLKLLKKFGIKLRL